MLNYCGIKGNDLIQFVVDASTIKQNKYLPGSRIPVLGKDNLVNFKPDYIVIFPWNIKDEIIDQLKFTSEWGCKFVIAIPSLKIIHMKILVTGATGFIGNYVISELLKLDYHIIATSTDIEKAKNFFWYSMIDYIPFDISTQTNINLMEYFNFPDLVIHLAWSNLPNYNDEIHTNVNLPNQILFLDNLIHNGLKNLYCNWHLF